MPIRPENKRLYPANWKQIREDILKRADNRCEFCGIPNHMKVLRLIKDNQEAKEIKIVLTIAHLDQSPQNNDYNNLRALCQRCHNRLDMPFRVANRKRRKYEKIIWNTSRSKYYN